MIPACPAACAAVAIERSRGNVRAGQVLAMLHAPFGLGRAGSAASAQARVSSPRRSARTATVMVQRIAIGGLVVAFVVQSRAVDGLADARIEVFIRALLVVVAATVLALGRTRTVSAHAADVSVGGRCAAFTALAGALHAAVATAPFSRCRAIAVPSTPTASIANE
jgi:hypothetical protein